MIERLTPLFWLLFSAGGMVAALLLPVHVVLLMLAFPLGWLPAPGYETLSDLVGHPLTRLFLLVLIALPLFHWAHRFRYTLYDGLQLYHLANLVAVLCYGTALVGTLLAAYVLVTF